MFGNDPCHKKPLVCKWCHTMLLSLSDWLHSVRSIHVTAKEVIQMNWLFTKQTQRLREQTYGHQGEETVRESGMDMHTLLHLKWITNKGLLYSTGNYPQYLVITYKEKRIYTIYPYRYTCITESLYCIPETSTFKSVQFSSVQSLSCARLFATPWIAACQASLSFSIISWSLLKLMPIELVIPYGPNYMVFWKICN